MNQTFPVDAIAPELLGDLPPSALTAQPAAAASQGTGFADMVSQGLAQVNESLLASQADMQRLATGDVQNLHHVMIGIEKSRLAFQLLLQVRGRLLEAYQDVMKMQI
ncbi:MAG TPA: flagellar hook-basal body complex protein FliE [Ramlibacter sp.]|uniref:flagellar hook-basal body complex protein FliE n=1 Tax=Ramlibacter sp. TaxID=1917967 RepID=UPI002CFED449|nr:flagellar hook-basal body complex protein FliE [Ramlibacter sp.]HVZ46124.1 flagellar hook-basal body complex protein FliE [Ramlibacter sp.]